MPTPSDSDRAPFDAEALDRQSLAWLNRLLSGAVSEGDAARFTAWRQQSPEHERAFTEAVRFQRTVRAAVQSRRSTSVSGATQLRLAGRPAPSRRVFIGGGLAASVAGAGVYLASDPPGHLWPSLAELTADYHTGVGQTRRLSAAPGVTMALNTRTAVARSNGGAPGVRLISGEASIASARPEASPFWIGAGAGQATFSAARINIRNDGGEVCLTCIDGEVRVSHPAGDRRLTAGQALTYGGGRLGEAETVDTTVATAWQNGLLIFRDAPLQTVVNELNRYRNGRIVLVSHALARRPVYAVFHTDQLTRAVDQVRALTGARETHLPGDIILLS